MFTANVAVDPAIFVVLSGWEVIVGRSMTVRVAPALITLPAVLVIVTE